MRHAAWALLRRLRAERRHARVVDVRRLAVDVQLRHHRRGVGQQRDGPAAAADAADEAHAAAAAAARHAAARVVGVGRVGGRRARVDERGLLGRRVRAEAHQLAVAHHLGLVRPRALVVDVDALEARLALGLVQRQPLGLRLPDRLLDAQRGRRRHVRRRRLAPLRRPREDERRLLGRRKVAQVDLLARAPHLRLVRLRLGGVAQLDALVARLVVRGHQREALRRRRLQRCLGRQRHPRRRPLLFALGRPRVAERRRLGRRKVAERQLLVVAPQLHLEGLGLAATIDRHALEARLARRALQREALGSGLPQRLLVDRHIQLRLRHDHADLDRRGRLEGVLRRRRRGGAGDTGIYDARGASFHHAEHRGRGGAEARRRRLVGRLGDDLDREVGGGGDGRIRQVVHGYVHSSAQARMSYSTARRALRLGRARARAREVEAPTGRKASLKANPRTSRTARGLIYQHAI